MERPKCQNCVKPAAKNSNGTWRKLCATCHSNKYRKTKNVWKPFKNETRKRRHARSPEDFLRSLLNYAKDRSKKSKKLGECELTYEYLTNLWTQQHGLCAITKLPMKHTPHKLDSASIDRLDTGIGYISGNVQLVCQFVNLARCDHPSQDLIDLLERYAAIKYERNSRAESTQND